MPPIWSCWYGAAFVSVHLETKLVLFDCSFLTLHQMNPFIFLWTCKHSLEKHSVLSNSQICNNTPLSDRGNWLDTENCLFTFCIYKKIYFHAFYPRTPVLVECKMCEQTYEDKKGRKAGVKITGTTRFFCWVLSSLRGQIQVTVGKYLAQPHFKTYTFKKGNSIDLSHGTWALSYFSNL